MAHIHSRLPRHSAPLRKKLPLFPDEWSEGCCGVDVGPWWWVYWGWDCLAMTPKKIKNQEKGSSAADFPPRSSGVVSARSPLQHTNTDSSPPPLVFSLRPNWVSLLHCCIESKTSLNNEAAVAARASTVRRAQEMHCNVILCVRINDRD